MFYWSYSLWNMYILMRSIHGVYITYSFFTWFLGSTYTTFFYMMSFIYNPYPVKQLEDHRIRKDIKVNDID